MNMYTRVAPLGAGCGVLSGVLMLLNPDPNFHSIVWAAVMFGAATTLAIGSIAGAIALASRKG
jgi:hypothetical protein